MSVCSGPVVWCVEVGLKELGGRVCISICTHDCYIVCVGSNVYLRCVGFG